MKPVHEIVKKIKDGSLTVEEFEEYTEGVCQRATEMALRSVPNVVDHVVKQAFFLNKSAQKFYKDNSDLTEHRALVVRMIEEVENKHPGLTYDELLERVAPAARERVKELKASGNTAEIKMPDLKKLGDRFGEI